MASDPTLIGVVQDVTGSTVSVELSHSTVTGLTFVRGEAYRIGQVGSFVRIPIGYVSLFGVVSEVGAGAMPRGEDTGRSFGNRWLTVQLVGEASPGGRFERGISQYPTIDDPVHVVTESDLRIIYGPGAPDDFVAVGRLASAESIPALVDINKLVTRHSAIVGSTGSGKSTTVASLLAALADRTTYPSARVLLLDIHGEYGRALRDVATVFRVNADSSRGEADLTIPFWALSFAELTDLMFGKLSDAQRAAVATKVLELKRESLGNRPLDGIESKHVTVDSPVPFCLHKLWFDLHKHEHHTLVPKPGASAEELEPAYVVDQNRAPVQLGDAMTITPPQYRTVKTTGQAAERVQLGKDPLGLRQHLAGLASKLRDPRLAFLLTPGALSPDVNGVTSVDLDQWMESWLGGPHPIVVLDLSGIPSAILEELVGAILRILYDAIFWARNLPEGGRERPLLVVLEEAHTYLHEAGSGSAAASVRRIAKEGRKYGVGLMLVSQRPSEIDSTILSQCGTFVAMRLSNDTDRGHIKSAASDNLEGLFGMLPVLRTGEAILVGEAVTLPIRALIQPPRKERLPDSVDPRVTVRGTAAADGYDGPGGWNQIRDVADYRPMVRQWRNQNPHYLHDTHRQTTPHNVPAGEATDGLD